MRVLRWLDMHLEELLMGILLVVIICVSFAQVIIRKVPWIPAFTWAEEFCRFCWIWSVFLSLPYTLRTGTMLRVTALLDILPTRIMKVLNIIVYVITTVCMALMGYYSIFVIQKIMQSSEVSPAMRWPMWIIYSIMLLGFFLASLRGLQQIIIHLNHTDKELNTSEMIMMDAIAETLASQEGGHQ